MPTLRLAYRPPLAWRELLAFLAPRATPGVEAVIGDAYVRTFDVAGARGAIEIAPAARGNALALRVRTRAPAALAAIEARARALFDLDREPSDVARVLRRDPTLRRSLRAHPGLRVPGAWDGFELAIRAILGQQVTVRGATSLAGRLARAFGEPLALGVADPPGLDRVFPTARALARARVERIGLPMARADAIRAVARAVADGAITLDRGAPDENVRALGELRGIGPWTCGYVAMRALGVRDAYPEKDLGLLRAVGDPDLAARAEAWRPWRAYAAMHLWTHETETKT